MAATDLPKLEGRRRGRDVITSFNFLNHSDNVYPEQFLEAGRNLLTREHTKIPSKIRIRKNVEKNFYSDIVVGEGNGRSKDTANDKDREVHKTG